MKKCESRDSTPVPGWGSKKLIGQPFLYPDNLLSLVHNFLRITFGLPTEPYEVDPMMADALDQLFMLHADHKQNCSTSIVRMVGSAQTNLFSSISAGINALFGPLHGGANQSVLEMLDRIHTDGTDVDAFVAKVKTTNAARFRQAPPGMTALPSGRWASRRPQPLGAPEQVRLTRGDSSYRLISA